MEHVDHQATSVEGLCAELRRILRHGARAGQLLTYSPALIDMLCPTAEKAGLGVPLSVRAMKAEDIIRKAITQIGGCGADALLIVLGLRPGTLGQSLERRRRSAARLLGIQPMTFRRDRHEKLLLLNLAMEIYRVLSDKND